METKSAIKRKRDVRGNVFWSDAMTYEFLSYINNHMDTFEKPTSQIFYKNAKEMIPALADMDWGRMRQKMRNLKCQYAKAKVWQEKVGITLNESEEYIQANITKMCPFWNELSPIMEKLSPTQLSSCESNESFDQFQIPKHLTTSNIKQENEENVVLLQPSDINMGFNYMDEEDLENNYSDAEINVQKRQRDLYNLPSVSDVSVQTDNLTAEDRNIKLKELEIKQKNSEIQALELKIKEEELNLKKIHLAKKFELIQTIISNQTRLRELEIAKDERIKKFEIELKYKMLQK